MSFLQCSTNNPTLHKISDICSFKLNKENQLVPCRYGDHLQNCKLFECNMMFKCPGYYCIHWNYICDGKWDCPGGYDESNECGLHRLCSKLFKCRDSMMCIHSGDTCDDKIDCPFGDDEDLFTSIYNLPRYV